jgi:3-hydroxyacyl-CoA dehydrogenase
MKENVIELSHRILCRLKQENGDVPGWVLVTVMTAGLVTALWLVADGQLSSVLNRAISQVAG